MNCGLGRSSVVQLSSAIHFIFKFKTCRRIKEHTDTHFDSKLLELCLSCNWICSREIMSGTFIYVYTIKPSIALLGDQGLKSRDEVNSR